MIPKWGQNDRMKKRLSFQVRAKKSREEIKVLDCFVPRNDRKVEPFLLEK